MKRVHALDDFKVRVPLQKMQRAFGKHLWRREKAKTKKRMLKTRDSLETCPASPSTFSLPSNWLAEANVDDCTDSSCEILDSQHSLLHVLSPSWWDEQHIIFARLTQISHVQQLCNVKVYCCHGWSFFMLWHSKNHFLLWKYVGPRHCFVHLAMMMIYSSTRY